MSTQLRKGNNLGISSTFAEGITHLRLRGFGSGVEDLTGSLDTLAALMFFGFCHAHDQEQEVDRVC